jgi:hypothetical protein
MRNWLLAILAILCLASCKPKRQVNVQQGPAIIEFDNDERSYDFGTVSRKQGIVTHDFVFVNTGSEPFVIHDTETSCGCLEAKYKKSPVRAGRESRITLVLDLNDVPSGYVKRSVYVNNNSKNRPNVRLVMEGVVEK